MKTVGDNQLGMAFDFGIIWLTLKKVELSKN